MRRIFPLTARVAWCYLFSKKRHGAVGVITAVAMCGVAVATAAIVVVLSVFNGFQDILGHNDRGLGPDVRITAVKGKTLTGVNTLLDAVRELPATGVAYLRVADKALGFYEGREMPVNLLGVDEKEFGASTEIKRFVKEDGAYILELHERASISETAGYDEEMQLLMDGEEEMPTGNYAAVISSGVAMRLGAHPDLSRKNDGDGFVLFAPRRDGQVNLANPSASFTMEEMPVAGVFQSMQPDFDKDCVIVTLDAARSLLGIGDDEASSIEVKGKSGVTPAQLASEIRKIAPHDVIVCDVDELHADSHRMVNIEKWVTFLLLAFILVIASFNIISALSMLVLDKEHDLGVLHALGMRQDSVGSVFRWESMLVTLIGGAAGLLLGVGLSLIQQHYGLIHLGGDPATLIIDTYPVVVKLVDLLIVAIPVVAIGLLTAFVTGRFAKSRISIGNL